MKGIKTELKARLDDFLSTFVRELRMIFTDSGVLVIFFIGGLLYPVLYNIIYMNGTLDEMPVAVVDCSGGQYSNRYLRKVDATRECEILLHCASMQEAERLMQQRKIHGIIYIHSDFDANIAQGRQGTVSTYSDMSSFLYYKSLTMAANLAMLDELHTIQLEHYSMSGMDGKTASQLVQPVLYDENLPYNKPFSYTIFFISAALMLVLQQTMFYGSALLAGTQRERGRSLSLIPDHLKRGYGMGRVVLGRGAAYFTVYMVVGTIVLLLIPWLFHLPQRAGFWEIIILLAFFLIDCIFFTFTWSALINKRETVFVLFLSISPILLFLTGFSWPESSIPAFWRYFSYLFPSTFGCRAFINLNTAGATLFGIAPEMYALTVQTLVYYFLANAVTYAENKIFENRDKIEAIRDKVNRRRGLDSEETRRIIEGD